MNGPCEEFADRIVDYVDGELPEDDARVVAAHLAECEPCRETARALQRSLGLAQILWSDNLAANVSPVPFAPAQRPRRIRFYAVAAGILLAASILLFTTTNHRPPQPSMTFDDAQRQVARAGTAAELLAATHLIAKCEGTESIVEQQYRYILREYADTPAAKSIRARYGSRLGGTQ